MKQALTKNVQIFDLKSEFWFANANAWDWEMLWISVKGLWNFFLSEPDLLRDEFHGEFMNLLVLTCYSLHFAKKYKVLHFLGKYCQNQYSASKKNRKKK